MKRIVNNKTKEFNEEDIYNSIEQTAVNVNDNTLTKIIKNSLKILKEASKTKGISEFVSHMKTGIEIIKDYKLKRYTDIPWRTVALIAAAIVYFINPIDILPDFFPVIGFTDDAVVLAAIFKSIQEDLKKYKEWKHTETLND